MKADDLDRTFDVLRELPVEVSAEQVGTMVAAVTLAPAAASSWFSQFFNLNSILMTSAGATIIAGSIYLLSPNDPAPQNANAQVPPVAPQVEMIETAPVVLQDTAPLPPAPKIKKVPPVLEEGDLALAVEPEEPMALENAIAPKPVIVVVPAQPATPAVELPLAAYDGMVWVRVGGKDFGLSDFTAVKVVGGMDVIVRQKEFAVTAEGDVAILEMLDLYVKDRTLVITLKDKEGKWSCDTEKPATVFVSMPTLEKVQLTGSGDVKVDPFTSNGGLDIDLEGSGDMDFSGLKLTGDLSIELDGSGDIVGEEVEVSGKTRISVAGSGDVRIAGSSTSVEANVVGSGDVETGALKAQDCDVNITGSGSVNVNCSGSMSSHIMGSGSVNNTGSAGGGGGKGAGGGSN